MVERLGEWFPFNAKLYCRKITLYDRMHWDVCEESPAENTSPFSLATCAFVRAAPFGGPVAVIHSIAATDTATTTSGSPGARVHVYTSAGEFQVCMCVSADVGAPIDMGWTREESLVILTNQQACVFFDCNFAGGSSSVECRGVCSTRTVRLQDVLAHTNHPLAICAAPTVVSCLQPDGLFCIDEDGWLRGMLHTECSGSVLLNPVLLDLDAAPAALDFIPAEWNDESKTVLYVATKPLHQKGDSTLRVFAWSVAFSEELRRHIPGGVIAMKVNHTGSHIAIFTARSTLYVLSSNLNSFDFSIDLGPRGGRPEKLEWCGHSFVMLHYNDSNFFTCYGSHHDAPMFSLLIPTTAESSVRCERLDWEREGSGHVATVSEVDGVRVITERSCYLLEQVPCSLVSLCRIKPLSASAQLVAAYTDTAKRLLNVRELLTKWGSSTFLVVLDEIIDAAAHEFSTDQQHLLLSAVFFANGMSRQYDSNTLVDVVRRLRMLHAVRNHCGCRIPLSFQQYCCLSGLVQVRSLVPSEARVLIDRLANRCCFQLALDITEAFNMKPQQLLSRWSCHKVRNTSLNDTIVHAHIREVLSRYPNSSYVDSALAAFRTGRSALAIKLLNEDFRTQSKVIVFLLIGQWELALHWAAVGDDADLLHLTITKVITSVEDRDKLFSLLLEHPTAVAWLLHGSRVLPMWRRVMEEMCVTSGDATLALVHAHCTLVRAVENAGKDFEGVGRKVLMPLGEVRSNSTFARTQQSEGCDVGGDVGIPAESNLWSILSESTPPSMNDLSMELGRCRQLHRSTSKKFALDAAVLDYPLVFPPFSADAVEGEQNWLILQHQLVEVQQALAEKYDDPRFFCSSVARTLYLCMLHGDEQHAEDMRVRYHVNEKKYVYTKLCALCDAAKWEEVEKLGGASGGRFACRPVIGYLPFIEQLTHHERVETALRFVPHLDKIAERVEWFLRLGQPCLAIDDAFREHDGSLIQHIVKKSRDTVTEEYGAQRLQELQ